MTARWPGGPGGNFARWKRQVRLSPGGRISRQVRSAPGGPGGQVAPEIQVTCAPGGRQVGFSPGVPGGLRARWPGINSRTEDLITGALKKGARHKMPGGPLARWAPRRQVEVMNFMF